MQEARERVKHDGVDVKMEDDGRGFESGAAGASAYADAASAYLALGVGRSANFGHRSRLGEEISLFRSSVDRRFQWFGIMPKATRFQIPQGIGAGQSTGSQR